ncbi:MAG: ribonucleotide-diphosphate reductase subunit alpha, partial [Syntrophomonadaceae bacterium]|nr:ribonucleotide-diphosphate reductase subunit alpha [Syntrophomonadaceae bacterium]
MQLTKNAKKVLESRILKKDENGEVAETPEEMLKRVSTALTNVIGEQKEFFDVMKNLYFLPNSPCLANAGTGMPQLQACFVLPIEDSMESIFGTLADMARVFKSGGGVGFALSRLRPKGDIVKTTGGYSSGPVSFLEPYNAAINAVKQGGRRKGAGLACIRVDHPDILEFIECKKDNDKFNNFNISVAITDTFMQAVKENTDFNLINPRNGEVTKTLPAKEIWDKLVEGAWRNGDPGILFVDEISRHNPTPELGEIESVNACSEFHGLPYESCNLGSINLTKIVTSDKEINWDLLEKVARIATRFLDNILDVTEYPLPQI